MAEKTKVQHWPSPWPYDFPVEGEAQTSASKVQRLVIEDKREPVKEAPKRPNPLIPLGVIAVLFAAWYFYPREEVDPLQVLQTKPKAEFAAETVDTSFKSDGVWIVHTKGQLVAISTACSHKGGTLIWHEGEKKFKCDCGSRFDIDGLAAQGPATSVLKRYRIYEDPVTGNIVVDKNAECESEDDFGGEQFCVVVK